MTLQVVWVNYQIMTTVGWNVKIQFPEPFATFERLLSVLDLSLLRIMPLACIVEYDFITPLVVAGVIVLVGVARADMSNLSPRLRHRPIQGNPTSEHSVEWCIRTC